jgi:excisionase family DNA binding protein
MGELANDSEKPLVVGVAETEHLLNCGKDAVYDLIKARELDSYLDGNRRKITRASIERYVQKRLSAATNNFERGRYPTRRDATT